MDAFLWGVLPYLCIASLVGGTVWRYRYDKFGWTTRSSQLYVASMAAAPIQFHIHALVGMGLFALWPFTRLVHAFTAPLHYLFRPYIVYRSRDRDGASGSRTGRPGWSGVGTTDRDRQR